MFLIHCLSYNRSGIGEIHVIDRYSMTIILPMNYDLNFQMSKSIADTYGTVNEQMYHLNFDITYLAH